MLIAPPHRSLRRRHAGAFCAAALFVALALPVAASPNDADEALFRSPSGSNAAASMPPQPAEPAEPSRTVQLMRTLRDGASELVVQAMGQIGVRYRLGGADADSGFDCSGFVRHVFHASLGLVLPRRADEQASAPGFVAVAIGDLRPGDLVFFNTLRRAFSHVGIYVGDGRFVHSPRSGAEIRTDKLGAAYWSRRFDGARRLETIALAPPT